MISHRALQHIQVGLSGTGFLCIILAFTANAQVKTETKVEESAASQTVKVETAEVVYISGNDLIVKTDDGELRHFPDVSDDKTVTVAGKELTVHDLKPGMKLQRTTITSTTPQNDHHGKDRDRQSLARQSTELSHSYLRRWYEPVL